MKIVIVGAGISGLAASYKLSKLGHSVQVLEASGRAGGRGQLLNRPGTDDWADVGSQYYHSNYTRALALIDDLGLSSGLFEIKGGSRMFTSSDGESFLLDKSRPWMPNGGLWGNISVGLYLAYLLIRYPIDPFGLKREKHLDSIAALDSSGNAFVRNNLARVLSLSGGLSEPSLSNVNLLQTLRLIRTINTTKSISLKSGTASLHPVLAEQADIRFNTAVSELLVDGDKVVGVRLTDGETVEADHVIVATNSQHAADIVPEKWPIEKQFLRNTKMTSTIIVSLFLDRALEEGVWSYMMPVGGEGSVSFCVDTQQKNPSGTPSGKATLQAWIPAPKSDDLMDLADDDLIQRVQAELEPYFSGIADWVEGADVTRHAMAMPQAHVGHNREAVYFQESIDRRKGVSFCGDYLSGGYMESGLWTVERAVERITESK